MGRNRSDFCNRIIRNGLNEIRFRVYPEKPNENQLKRLNRTKHVYSGLTET